jgi:hypothetical protein
MSPLQVGRCSCNDPEDLVGLQPGNAYTSVSEKGNYISMLAVIRVGKPPPVELSIADMSGQEENSTEPEL